MKFLCITISSTLYLDEHIKLVLKLIMVTDRIVSRECASWFLLYFHVIQFRISSCISYRLGAGMAQCMAAHL